MKNLLTGAYVVNHSALILSPPGGCNPLVISFKYSQINLQVSMSMYIHTHLCVSSRNSTLLANRIISTQSLKIFHNQVIQEIMAKFIRNFIVQNPL